jgi:hypothetical protein
MKLGIKCSALKDSIDIRSRPTNNLLGSKFNIAEEKKSRIRIILISMSRLFLMDGKRPLQSPIPSLQMTNDCYILSSNILLISDMSRKAPRNKN